MVVTVLSQFSTFTVCKAISMTKPSELACGISIQSPILSMSLEVSCTLATNDNNVSLNINNTTADMAPRPDTNNNGERSISTAMMTTMPTTVSTICAIWINPLIDPV